MNQTVSFMRTATIPDRVRIERYRREPELGPRILFFTGGTALREMSTQLIEYTHNSIHLVTPFDSGGSSAAIRESFNMISVGDLRNRLMALADQSVKGNPDIYTLFAYRLPHEDSKTLIHKLYEMIQGVDPLVSVIPDPMKQIICNHLRYFVNKMPINFDMRGANIGNLILTGGYLNNAKDMETVLFLFSKLVEARGIVKPTVTDFLHLVAELENGEEVVGQHLLTGKEHGPIQSKVLRTYLTDNQRHPHEAIPEISDNIHRLITKKAELIIYPMGSFYSSVAANLLPKGIGSAIAASKVPKVYIPNTSEDPEQRGMSLYDTVVSIHEHAARYEDASIAMEDILDFVLVDTENATYSMEIDIEKIESLGVRIINTGLITGDSTPKIDPGLLIHTLLSLT